MINLNSPIQTHKHMSSALFIENKHSAKVRKKTLSQKIEFGMTSLTFLTIILVAIISLIYLAHANRNATKGYALKGLENELNDLKTQMEVGEMQIAKVSSLDHLLQDPQLKTMVSANEPMFIGEHTALAAR